MVHETVNIIKNNVKMQDIFSKYGFVPNRGGFINCPFHGEKTASLKAYKNGERFNCFGCGLNGSVIDFVMKLYNLSFKQAIVKIGYDFGLALPLGRQLTARERHAHRKAERERMRKRKNDEFWKWLHNAYEDVVWRHWLAVDKILTDEKPTDENAEWSEAFCLALREKALIDYEVDCLHERRGSG